MLQFGSMLLLVLQLSACLLNQMHFSYPFTVVHDGLLHRNQRLCHIVLPLSTKHNTIYIRHTLMDIKFHHCGGIHCFDHHGFNEMCKL